MFTSTTKHNLENLKKKGIKLPIFLKYYLFINIYLFI